MQLLVLFVLVTTLAPAGASVFRHVGPDGETYFSDRPATTDAVPVEIGPTQTIRMPASRPRSPDVGAAAASGSEKKTLPAYAEFSIVKPSHNQGVRANDGGVTVYLELSPPLKPGHVIVLNVDGEDGETIRTGETLNFNLVDMSRGRHSVAAKVVDEQGNTLIETGPLGFYVLRAALGQRVRTQ